MTAVNGMDRFGGRLRRAGAAALVSGALWWLTGCAALQPAARAPAPQAAPAPVVRKIPPAPLTGKLLYHLLAGDLAIQRGHMDFAFEQYLDAARGTRDPRVAEMAARLAGYAHRKRLGLEAAERWVSLEPESANAQEVAVVLAVRAAQNDKALAHLESLLALPDPVGGRALLRVAGVLVAGPDRDAALAVFKRLAQRRPKRAVVHLALARVAFQTRRLPLAAGEAGRALALRAGWSAAALLLAEVRIRQGHVESALAELGRVVDAHPRERRLRLAYARLLLQAGRLPDAAREFHVLVRRNPKDADAIYALGLLSLQAQRPKDAQGYLARLVKLGVRTNEAHYYLGRIAESEGHPSAALAEYRRVRQGELGLDAQIRIARILALQGDVQAARTRLENLRRHLPGMAVRLYLAETAILREAKHYRQAMTVYDQALRRYPDNNDLLYGRALVAEHLGELQRSEGDLRTILARDPDNAMALNALGYTLADRTTRYREALGYIQKALKRRPNDPAILDSMGWVQYRLGHYPQALSFLRRALKLSGGNDEIAAHLGEVLWTGGEHAAARKVWQAALRRHPDSTALRAVVQRLAP